MTHDDIRTQVRGALEIVMQLRETMNEIVCDYDPDDPDSVQPVGEPIDGTAFFPGGHGLWRGAVPHGPMPEVFPDSAVMFVGHNFDSLKHYRWSVRRGIEVMEWPTWKYLRRYLEHASLREEQCFFTNALMGLQPVSSEGDLKTTARFREQCVAFLHEQIEIVRPRAVIALGKPAAIEVANLSVSMPKLNLLHPRAATRHPDLAPAAGRRLRQFLANV